MQSLAYINMLLIMFSASTFYSDIVEGDDTSFMGFLANPLPPPPSPAPLCSQKGWKPWVLWAPKSSSSTTNFFRTSKYTYRGMQKWKKWLE